MNFLLIICFFIFTAKIQAQNDSLIVTFYEKDILVEKDIILVENDNKKLFYSIHGSSQEQNNYSISFSTDEYYFSSVNGSTQSFSHRDIIENVNFTLELIGNTLGRSNLGWTIYLNTTSIIPYRTKAVNVLLKETPLQTTIMLVVNCVVAINTMNIGMIVNLKTLKNLLKSPAPLFVGFLSQHIFMPLVL